MKRLSVVTILCLIEWCASASAQSLIQNGGFTVGTYDDPMTNQSAPPWQVAYGTPQVKQAMACDQGLLQMWGNLVDGESVYQVLSTPIQKGHSYAVTACIAFWDNNPQNYTPYVRVRFSAANTVPFTPPWPSDGVTGEEIGFVQTSNQGYVTYTLPLWTAQNDYTNFGVSVEDDNTGTNSATWGHIDQVTLTECTNGTQVMFPTTNMLVQSPSCNQVDSAFAIVFRSCTNDSGYLAGVTLRGSQNFQLGPVGSLPRFVTIDSIPFSFNPIGAASDTAFVDITYFLNGNQQDTTIELIGQGIAEGIGVKLGRAVLSAPAKDTVSIPCYLFGTADAATLQSIGIQSTDVAITINMNLLQPDTIFSGLPNGNIIPFTINGNVVNFTIPIPAGLTFTDSIEVARIRFKTFISDTLETGIQLISATLNTSGTSPCLTVSNPIGGTTFMLNVQCGDSLISNFLKHNPSFTIESIAPNPTSGQVEIGVGCPLEGVGYQVSGVGGIDYEVVDALGRMVKRGTFNGTTLKLDFSTMQSGSYFVRFSSFGQVETRRVVLAR